MNVISEDIFKLYNQLEGDECQPIDSGVVDDAISIINNSNVEDSKVLFLLLSAINLLNAAIKTEKHKSQLFYGFIKTKVSKIADTIILSPSLYNDTSLFYDSAQKCIYFEVFGMKLILVIGMFPGFLGMFISYAMLKTLGLYQGYLGLEGLVLISIAGSAGGYYISKGFFDTISKSLDEAAMIDGANKNTIFWLVIMPLSKPIFVYTLLMGFTGPWGDYMFASVIAGGDSKIYNVAVGLQQMLSKGYVQETVYPQFCAAAVVVSIPIMILFFKFQNYYVEGVTGGAVKG